jgi:RNA polymerase sigma-70 factor (ECF subfamily)
MGAVIPLERRAGHADHELARRSADGDTAAFARLIRRHNRLLFRTARAILRDGAEAEDALQDAYLRAYWSIGGFREGRLSTWLVRVVADEALARLRRRTRVADLRRLLEARIDALPSAHRLVFVLGALEGLPVDEIGSALGIGAQTARSRLFRARRELRDALALGLDPASDAFPLDERGERIVAQVAERLAQLGEGPGGAAG